jgi:hypothetical protein
MKEKRDASPVRKDLTKKKDNPWPACASECSDDVVADDCEFSPDGENDIHHCVDCRDKWWDDKMKTCDCCNDWWCPDWQSAFVWLEDCECKDSWKQRRLFAKKNKVANSELHFVCPTCFIKDGIHCLHPECETSPASLLKDDEHRLADTGEHVHHTRLLEALRTISPK